MLTHLYVLGFLFNVRRDAVLLIEKRRPAWQAGRLNGIGGKVHLGESPRAAMQREAAEEAGVHLLRHDWRAIGVLDGDDWRVHLFSAVDPTGMAHSCTDEPVRWYPLAGVEWAHLPAVSIANLSTLVAHARDPEHPYLQLTYGQRAQQWWHDANPDMPWRPADTARATGY